MANKALIVGISNYGETVPGLQSPNTEIQEWRDLLVGTYQFAPEDIRLLANERARKDELVTRLHWLFDNGKPGDKLVFIYSGHGVKLPERNDESGELLDHLDEALLTYPGPGDDMSKMAFYDKDLFALYESAELKDGTYTTFILDCCFAGGINLRDVPHRPVPMSVTPPVDLQHRSLGRHQRRYERNASTDPVLVTAAGELNLAVEIDVDGKRRSLFGYHAIRALRNDPKLTYHNLLKTIQESIESIYPQYPNVRGNHGRLNNLFLN